MTEAEKSMLGALTIIALGAVAVNVFVTNPPRKLKKWFDKEFPATKQIYKR